jgi:pimeloyl-ACP methyl ester carboxylesterase
VLDPSFRADADAIVRSIAGFLDALELERTAIMGHSWGGGFGLRFAELHPARVTRLALLAPGGLDVRTRGNSGFCRPRSSANSRFV